MVLVAMYFDPAANLILMILCSLSQRFVAMIKFLVNRKVCRS